MGFDYQYQPQSQFLLERDFLKNPLMATIKLARFKFPAKMISDEDDILDLGCGSGLSTYFYSKFTKGRVTGIDLNSDIDEHTKNLDAENLTFYCSDIVYPNEEIVNKKYDLIISVDVIEHFPKEIGEFVLNKYYDLLRPGGMMIVGTPNKNSSAYRSESSKKVHVYEYEPDELLSIMKVFSPRVLQFSMNDEVIHTGFNKMSWFFYNLAFKV